MSFARSRVTSGGVALTRCTSAKRSVRVVMDGYEGRRSLPEHPDGAVPARDEHPALARGLDGDRDRAEPLARHRDGAVGADHAHAAAGPREADAAVGIDDDGGARLELDDAEEAADHRGVGGGGGGELVEGEVELLVARGVEADEEPG